MYLLVTNVRFILYFKGLSIIRYFVEAGRGVVQFEPS